MGIIDVRDLGNGFAISHLRRADVGVDIEFALHPVDQNFQVQFTHALDDRLAAFLVGSNLERRVFRRQTGQRHAHFFLIALGLGLHRHFDHRIGKFHPLEHHRIGGVAYGVAGGGGFESHQGDNIAGPGFLYFLAGIGMHFQHPADAFLSVLYRVEDGGTGFDNPGINPEKSQRTDERVVHDLEGQTGKRRVIGKRTELRAMRRSGEEFPMELTITTFEEGEKRMFTAFVRDISEREQILGTLQIAKEEAEAANRAKTDFLSSMSHELRTPMNAVLGFSQLLRRSKKEPLMSKQAKHVEQIEKAGKHLLELINEVLDLSKIESGKLLLSLEDISPSIVILEAFNLVVPMAETQNIGLVDKTGAGEYKNVIVKADYTRFKQVLVNLLSNAVKYSRDAGDVTLEYGEASQEGCVRFSVIDCGLGIPEGKLKEIFQPFTRLGAEDQDIEGTGVGLSITEKLVKLMDGKVGAESMVGEGSTFWFELPLGGEKNGEETASQVKAAKAGKGRDRKCTMLYVEDNPANLRLMEEILADLPNLTLLSAHTPQLGLKLARVCKADLIVLDINLPGLNGFKILNRLRNYEETNNIPVIAISANAMPKDIEKGLSAGFLAYLTKPLNIDQFLDVVESTLGREDQ